MAAQYYKINYKSDFVLTINSDAGWAVPFCIKFWTGMPSYGYFAGFDGENYVNCRVGDTPTQLLVMFDDHHMPIGELKMQIAYHTTIEEFPDRKFDEVTNPTNVTVDIDGTEYQVMLDFTGETGAEIDFSMPSSGVMSVNGKIGYVTLNAEDVGAQPTIEDLSTIRSGAAAGATAVQPAEMTAALATKQDTIPDLATIRSGAAAGATAVQPATLQEGLAGKQDTISDLATIRSGAAAGATAVQPAALQEGLAGKQDTISDLATIRSGAAAGSTAYQKPGTGIPESDLASGVQSSLHKADAAAPQSNTYTKGEVDTLIAGAGSDIDVDDALSTTSENPVQNKVVTTALNGKQATISDLSTIRSGAAAGATAVQPTTLQEGLAGKQDTINDLATIRSGAAAGATAVQPAALTPIENDIDAIEGKIPSAASTSNQLADKAFVNSALSGKADTSDIPTALSQLSQDSTHRVVTDTEKSTWNGKQNAINDLATIRSGAAAGATAVQPAAMNAALAAKQDTLTFDNTPTANSNNPVKSSGIKTALDAKQNTISTVNVTVDNNTGTPSGSASVSGSTLSLSFQNLKGATGATGATGPQGPQGERGLPGESGVTGDVSGFTVIQTIDPSATYGATDIAGAATVQATNQELTELSGGIDKEYAFSNMACGYPRNNGAEVKSRYRCVVEATEIPITIKVSGIPTGFAVSINLYTTQALCFDATANPTYSTGWNVTEYTTTDTSSPFICINVKKDNGTNISESDITTLGTLKIRLSTSITVDEVPTEGSGHLVRSGGIYNAVAPIQALQQDVSEINDALYGNATVVTKGLEDADVALVKKNLTETTTVTEAFRLRLIYPVPQGATFLVKCTLYSGVTVVLYQTRAQVVIGNTDYIENYSGTYTTDTLTGITSAEGFLGISWKNKDGSTFTQADYDAFMANVQVSISYYDGVAPSDSITGRINALENGFNDTNVSILPIPQVVQGSYVTGNTTNTEGGVGDTSVTNECVTNSLCLLPYNGVKLHVVLPDNVGCWFKTHNGPTVKNAIGNFYVNGDIISCAPTHNAYMIAFCYISGGSETGATIDPSDVNTLIDSGQIKFWYEEKEGNTIQRTTYEDTYVKAVTDCWDGSYNTQYASDHPVLAHVSDLHGDSVRLRNALEWSEYKGVDAVINTGDNVFLTEQSGLGFVANTGSGYSVAQIQVVGNHDAKGDNTYRADSNSELYDKLISPFIAASGYSMPSSSQYNGEPTYYYKDFSTKKLRLIVLNQYEQGAKNAFNNGRISQRQIDWFINVLESTPQNYGVVLAYHANFTRVNIVNGYESFFETLYSNDYPRKSTLAGINTEPVTRIIDAFISKGTTSFTYTNLLLDNTTETITVTADFTSLNSGVEFIAHLFGHIHQDTVGYYNNTTNTQLALGVNSSPALYETTGTTALANPQDMPRGGRGINQDCFNVYCIDRDRKVVRIAKVGSNMTVELTRRDCMSIPYAT